MMNEIILHVGKTIDIESGIITDGEDTVMSSVLFYYVDKDTILR